MSTSRARTPMDPALRRFLDERATLDSLATGPAPRNDLERARATRAGVVAALQARAAIDGLPNDVVARDVAIGASLSGRLFVPAVAAPMPVLVYLHGGGWVAGSTATHDPFCRLLAAAASVSLVSIDYRLAPEHRHPAALDDAFAAVDWAVAHASEWGGDPSRLLIGGDSAGGNLAAVVTNRLVARGFAVAAQVLLFPVTDHPSAGHASYQEQGYNFGAEFMEWVWRQYAPDGSPDDPSLSPLRAAIPRLPPTCVQTAEHDILRDEGLAYVEKLRGAGVEVTHRHAEDMHHNFCVNPATVGRFPQCQAAIAALASWIGSVT